jgi:threonine dehydratase
MHYLGNAWQEANHYLTTNLIPAAELDMVGEEAIYIHPFDHREISEGNACITKEVARQFQDWAEFSCQHDRWKVWY